MAPLDEAMSLTLTSDAGGTPTPRQPVDAAPARVSVHQYEWRGAWVVTAHGPFDTSTVGPLADALKAGVERHPKVVLDAFGITFADSTLLNLLILTHQAGTLRVVAPSQQVRRLCEITGVDTLLEIRRTVDEAVDS
ncbi:STAS domain-containing protein [Streptomyces fragilis]|uniref:STAS domain-containing protein n=1 Tax=Streptomyces fragilis TaxID=67301 RepID=A0ABV2YCK7_9ACTN|nr:STAS domain-containing protein [Streptomyces fragilis]